MHVNFVDLVKSFLTNIYHLLAKIGVDTAENELSEILKLGCRPKTEGGPCSDLKRDPKNNRTFANADSLQEFSVLTNSQQKSPRR